MGEISINKIYLEEVTRSIAVGVSLSPPKDDIDVIYYTLETDGCLSVINSKKWQDALISYEGTAFFTITGDKEHVDKFADYIENGPPANHECLNQKDTNIAEEL